MNASNFVPPNPTRVPLSLFYVTYFDGDILGKGLALTSQIPLLLFFYECLTLFILIFSLTSKKSSDNLFKSSSSSPSSSASRLSAPSSSQSIQRHLDTSDKQLLWLWPEKKGTLVIWLSQLMSFQLLNEIFARYLKVIIGHDRPKFGGGDERHEFGCPSSHTMFMGFWMTFIMIRCFQQSRSSNNSLKMIRNAIISLCTMILTFLVAFSRVYLGYHYWYQVIVGICFGIILALAEVRLCGFFFEKIERRLHSE